MKVTLLPGPSDAESDEYHARRRAARPAAAWRTKWGSSDCDDKEGEMATKAELAGDALAEAVKRNDDLLNEGAQRERDAVRAYLRRLSIDTPLDSYEEGQVDTITRILKWLGGRSARFSKAPGGLRGRATKAKAKGKAKGKVRK